MPKDSSRAKRPPRATQRAVAAGPATFPALFAVASLRNHHPYRVPALSPCSTTSSGSTDVTGGSSSHATLSATTTETTPEPLSPDPPTSNAVQPDQLADYDDEDSVDKALQRILTSWQDNPVLPLVEAEEDSAAGRKIPRPNNVFFVFKKAFLKAFVPRQKVPGKYKMKHGRDAACARWREIKADEDKTEYNEWVELTERVKAEHSRLFPGYKYRPQTKRSKEEQKATTGKVATEKKDMRKKPYERNHDDELSTPNAGPSNSQAHDPMFYPSSTELPDLRMKVPQRFPDVRSFPSVYQPQQAAMNTANVDNSFTFFPPDVLYPWLDGMTQPLPSDLGGAQGEMQAGSSNQPMSQEFVFPGQDPEYVQVQDYGDAQVLNYDGFQELNYHYPQEHNQGSHPQHYYEPNVGMMPAEPVFFVGQEVLDANFRVNGFNGQYPQEYDGGAQGF